MNLKQFFHQPSTVLGLSGITGALTGVLSGQMTWLHAVPVMVGSLVAILVPDNTALQHDAAAVTADLLNPKGTSPHA